MIVDLFVVDDEAFDVVVFNGDFVVNSCPSVPKKLKHSSMLKPVSSPCDIINIEDTSPPCLR
jgi:hypothetical protein